MFRKVVFGNDAQLSLREGLELLYRAVAATLGPGGKNIIIKTARQDPVSTKDGVTVARFVEANDEVVDAAVQTIKQAAQRANDVAGDGTTSATVLAKHIYDRIMAVSKDINPHRIREELEAVVEDIVEELKKNTNDISHEQIELTSKIGEIAGNSASVGKLVSEAFFEAGARGTVLMRKSMAGKTTIDVKKGFVVESGPESPKYYPGSKEVVFEAPRILVIDGSISDGRKFVSFLKNYTQEVARNKEDSAPLLILGGGIRGDAEATFVANVQKGVIAGCSVFLPFFGEDRYDDLKDLATYIGAEVITEEDFKAKPEIPLSCLGTAPKVSILANQTIIVGDDNEAVEQRILEIQADEKVDETRKTKRVARLGGKFSTINVGGQTESELAEKGYRIEDAINAVRAALKDGVLPAGGVSLMYATRDLKKSKYYKGNSEVSEDKLTAFECIDHSVYELFNQILTNIGYDSGRILNFATELLALPGFECSYNYRTLEVVNALERGLLDPVHVICSSLSAGVSAATMLSLTDGVIADDMNALLNAQLPG